MTATKPLIYADSRELRSGVIKELSHLNCEYDIRVLEVADYILSEKVAVERKATEDFLKSFIEDRKLFDQIRDLVSSYERPLMIIEGVPEELFTLRMINPDAVWGILETITVSFRCPILFTLNPKETATRLYSIAFKEQNKDKKPFHPHGSRHKRTPDEQLEYTLTSLPDMGVVTAKSLLSHFGTLQNVVMAPAVELQEVSHVGEKTSAGIYEFFRRGYKG